MTIKAQTQSDQNDIRGFGQGTCPRCEQPFQPRLFAQPSRERSLIR